MVKKEDVVASAMKLMDNRKNIRNIGIVAHIDHGKTTLSDNLVAAAGIINPELAGKVQFMDYYELEQQRGITINSANISLVHEVEGKEYLINLIDTPGHIDFGGEVIRAMRAVDGAVIVVDAVEGTMPQTETVIRQALKENVKPTLFINKVDRLVTELNLTQDKMQEKFVKVIAQVNELIKKNVPKKFVDKWTVSVQNGSVGFGSAKQNWGLSALTMKETKIGFKEVYDYCSKEGGQKELAKLSPMYKVVLDMVIQHLPDPLESQAYRVPVIWKGDIEKGEGKSMLACNKDGPIVMMVTDVSVDPHAGDIATGRIYSGTVERGKTVKLVGSDREITISQVGIMMGVERITVDKVPAGNIASLVGLKEVYAGQTIAEQEIKEFESFMSSAEPVMTVCVEPKNPKDLPKLIEVIRKITKEDPNIRASLNQETGEHLLSGMGELHLEVTEHRISHDNKIPIQVSPPIVVFRETMRKPSQVLETRSPNKHNKFKIIAEPIPAEVLEKLIEARIHGKIKPKDKAMWEKLQECGLEKDDAKKVWAVENNCLLLDKTRGIEALHEIRELVIQGFRDAMKAGPLAMEKCLGIKVSLTDASLHEDAIHRGPAQVLPAITRGIYACALSGDPMLLEPKQNLAITVPMDYMGAVSKELGARRTQIKEMRQEGDQSIIVAKAPVKELIGFSQTMRSATQGRAVWTAEYAGYELLPRELQKEVVKQIRTRKGLEPEPKSAGYFLE